MTEIERELAIRDMFLGNRKQMNWVCLDKASAVRIKQLVESIRQEFEDNGYLEHDVKVTVEPMTHGDSYICEVRRVN